MLRPSATLVPGVLESPLLAAVGGVVHGFTTRQLGSASSTRHGEDTDALARALELGPWRRCEANQVHGRTAARAAAGSRPDADGLVSDRPGDLLVVRSADCATILAVVECEPPAVAALHAGWRGLLAGMIDSGLDALSDLAPTGRVIAALGPMIGPCCFEVGPDVAARFAALDTSLVRPGRRDRPHVDLPSAARLALQRRGVSLEDAAPPCTACNEAQLHSYRRDGAAAGRMAAFVGLLEARP